MNDRKHLAPEQPDLTRQALEQIAATLERIADTLQALQELLQRELTK